MDSTAPQRVSLSDAPLKFRVKGPDGKLAYSGDRIMEVGRVCVDLCADYPDRVVVVQSNQGNVQVIDGVVSPYDLVQTPEWIDDLTKAIELAKLPPPATKCPKCGAVGCGHE